MPASEKSLALVPLRQLVHVPEHAIGVARVFVSDEQVGNVGLPEGGTVLLLVLLDSFVLFVGLHGAFDGFAPLAISDREEEGVFTLTVDEVAHPARRIIASEDMALVCLD
jgi:hypothetical protein